MRVSQTLEIVPERSSALCFHKQVCLLKSFVKNVPQMDRDCDGTSDAIVHWGPTLFHKVHL